MGFLDRFRRPSPQSMSNAVFMANTVSDAAVKQYRKDIAALGRESTFHGELQTRIMGEAVALVAFFVKRGVKDMSPSAPTIAGHSLGRRSLPPAPGAPLR